MSLHEQGNMVITKELSSLDKTVLSNRKLNRSLFLEIFAGLLFFVIGEESRAKDPREREDWRLQA